MKKDSKTVILNRRQEAILNLFDTDTELPVSEVFQSVKKLGNSVSQITVSRDLKTMVQQGFFIRKGAGRSVVYTLSPQYIFRKEIDVEKYFAKDQDTRVIKKQFDFDVFKLLEEEIFNVSEKRKLESLHNMFHEKIERIESKTIIAKEFERIIIEFSWKSSQIEGNTYSLLDTERLIKENKKAEGKTEAETTMVLNHKKAFEYALKNKGEFAKLSRGKLENIHSILVAGLSISKNLRKSPVGITGTNYKPLDNIFQIEEAVEKMVLLINEKDNFFEKAFLCLILMSYIQPFEDGNKRTARMVSNALLLAYGTTPISYRAVDEVEYKKATLIFYEINNLAYFKNIFIKQYEFAVENYF